MTKYFHNMVRATDPVAMSRFSELIGMNVVLRTETCNSVFG